MRSALANVAAGAIVAASLSGCGEFSATGLQLRQDDSIEFESPGDGRAVQAPFALAWSDDARPAGSRYAVVINRSPMPPGERLDWFLDDDACDGRDNCPSLDELRLRGVVVTDEPTAEIVVVPSVIGGREGRDDEFIVIRIDADGRRISEAAFLQRLDVEPRAGL